MPGLIDITPAVETIDVRGHNVTVSGLSVEAIGGLFLRFPQFREMVETNKYDIPSLLKMSDEAIGAIIAASCGGAFSEQTAGLLVLAEKAEILGAILRITMPRGPGPFVDLMQAVGLVSAADSASSLRDASNTLNGTGTRRPKGTRQESSQAGLA